MTISTCSCGETSNHVIAKRSTADGIAVQIWHDGMVTGRFGHGLPGVPIVRPRTAEAVERERRAASLFADEVILYDLAEVPRLYDCARRIAAKGGGRREFLAAFAAKDAPAVNFVWETYQTDRDGRPTVRVARLDRIRWPGYAVWHESGVYKLFAITRSGYPGCSHMEEVLEATGFEFKTQRDLCRHLYEIALRWPTNPYNATATPDADHRV